MPSEANIVECVTPAGVSIGPRASSATIGAPSVDSRSTAALIRHIGLPLPATAPDPPRGPLPGPNAVPANSDRRLVSS
jgi:hypothetical protein